LLHLLHGFGDARARGLLAAAERRRDLAVGAAFDLVEHERRALPRRQRADRRREVGQRHAVALRGGETQLRERPEAAISPRPIDRLVRRDLVQPRALGAATRWRPRAESREEGLLIEVVRAVARPDEAQRVHEDLALVALDELAESESTCRHRPEGRTRKDPPM